MNEQLRLGIIDAYFPDVEIKLLGATITLYSADNYELYNFLYFNKIKCSLDPIRGVLCSVLEVKKILNFLKSVYYYDKTTEIFVEVIELANNPELPIVLKHMNPEEINLRFFDGKEQREEHVKTYIQTALRVCGVPVVYSDEPGSMLKSRIRVVSEYSVDNVLELLLSDPSKIADLNIEVCWRLSAVKFACPAILGQSLRDRPGFIFTNTNYYESLSQKYLESLPPEELIKVLRRLVLIGDIASLAYIPVIVSYVSKIYENPAVVTSESKISLWQEFTNKSNVTIFHESANLTKLERYDIVVIDDLEPSKIQTSLSTHLKTDLDANALFLTTEEKMDDDNLSNSILSIIRPFEFDAKQEPDEYYVGGLDMFYKHRRMYAYWLKTEDSYAPKILYISEGQDPEKEKFGSQAYTNKFSRLVSEIKEKEYVEIIGLKSQRELSSLFPRTKFSFSFTARSRDEVYRVLFDTTAKNNLVSFFDFDLIFIDEENK